MTVSPRDLRAMILDPGELALVDVREEARFGAGHLLWACNVPASRLEMLVADRVPRRATRIVLCDGGEGLAERCARRLEGFGYTGVAVLEGGVPAWRDAGFEVFSGMNVPSKAFGELVEHRCATPSIAPEELKGLIDTGEDLVILDSRPLAEYRAMSIPGGTCVPGAELAYRVRELAPSPDTLVVVNCAGRTRSIIGAQSLINAGIPNRVVALRNGTMGWHLAGLELAHGEDRYLPEVSAETRDEALARASRLAERCAVTVIGRDDLARFRAEAHERSLYLLDVRSPEEYVTGHLPGALSAPGGQLVQATDRYVGTLKSRLVLVDDTGVRARMTASWLAQMGWPEVCVLDGGLDGGPIATGPQPVIALGLDEPGTPMLRPAELAAGLAKGGVAVIDLSRSLAFREAHVEGARHAVRGDVDEALGLLPAHELLVLTSEDGVLATLAYGEIAALARAPVKILQGGNTAWRAAGFAMASGDDGLLGEPPDVFLRPYDRRNGIEEAMHAYLDWEVDLVHQIERDGTTRFSIVAPPEAGPA